MFCKLFLPYICTPLKRWNDSVAQLVEQYTFNVWVLGSSPSGITKKATSILKWLFTFYYILCTRVPVMPTLHLSFMG